MKNVKDTTVGRDIIIILDQEGNENVKWCVVCPHKIWGNWKSGLKKLSTADDENKCDKDLKTGLERCSWPSSWVIYCSLKLHQKSVEGGQEVRETERKGWGMENYTRTRLKIRLNRSHGVMNSDLKSTEKLKREVQQEVSTDICKARWRLDGGLKLSVSSDRIYEHRIKHHVIPCSSWQCSQKVYRLFFCLHIVCPFTFADVSINAFTYFPFSLQKRKHSKSANLQRGNSHSALVKV